MLTHREALSILVQRDLLRTEPVVAGDLRIEAIARRNTSYKVISRSGPSFLVKQGADGDITASVAHEAALYRLFQEHPACDKVRRFLPHFYGCDPDTGALILELIPWSEPVRSARSLFSVRTARGIGEVLGRLHIIRLPPAVWRETWLHLVPCVPAPHRPTPGTLREVSGGILQMIRIIQEYPAFCGLLDEVRSGWQAEALIHGDLKRSNWIVGPNRGRKRWVKLVDWEFGGIGDPCWDVGSVFADYLSAWLVSIPVAGQTAPEMMAPAQYPLERIQPAIGAFWTAYRQQLGLDDAAAAQWLLRSVRYAAAGLVRNVLDQAEAAQLTGNAICCLQVSFNMLQHPEEARIVLLGIPELEVTGHDGLS